MNKMPIFDPRTQLMAEIEALKNTAKEVAPGAAVVLAGLFGALIMGEEDALAAYYIKRLEHGKRKSPL